jgi:hypothetical protein
LTRLLRHLVVEELVGGQFPVLAAPVAVDGVFVVAIFSLLAQGLALVLHASVLEPHLHLQHDFDFRRVTSREKILFT